MMLIERRLDRNNGTAAFPSFHVVWAFLGAAVFASRQQLSPRGRRLAGAWWIWAALVAMSCVMTGMHSLTDVLAGFAVFVLTYGGVARGEREAREVATETPRVVELEAMQGHDPHATLEG